MKIRSRGLGRRELAMDVTEFKVRREGNEVVLDGVTHAPITWETTIRMSTEDVWGLVKVAANRRVLGLVLRWVFHVKDKPVETVVEVSSWSRRTQRAGAPVANTIEEAPIEVAAEA